jgi:hypothetical protein
VNTGEDFSLQREHQALENMKLLYFFFFFGTFLLSCIQIRNTMEKIYCDAAVISEEKNILQE